VQGGRADVKALHNTAPRYLGPLVRVADIPGRRAFRSAVTDRLAVPSVRLHTVGNRTFPVCSPEDLEQLVGRRRIFYIPLYLLPPTENSFVVFLFLI